MIPFSFGLVMKTQQQQRRPFLSRQLSISSSYISKRGWLHVLETDRYLVQLMTTFPTQMVHNHHNMTTTLSKNLKWEFHISRFLSILTISNLIVTGGVMDERHHLKQGLSLVRPHKLQQLWESAAVPERLLQEEEFPKKN